MKAFTFKNRLFAAFAAITAAVVSMFTLLLILYTFSLNRKAELIRQREIFQRDVEEIESIMYQAGTLAMRTATNMSVLNAFIPLDNPGNAPDENYFDENLLEAIHLSSIIADVLFIDSPAARISVFNRYGDYLSSGRLYETESVVRQTLASTDWIDETLAKIQRSPNGAAVTGSSGDMWSDNQNIKLICVSQAISYTAQSHPYGLVSVQIDEKHISDLAFWNDGSAGVNILLDVLDGNNPGVVYKTPGSDGADGLLDGIADYIQLAMSDEPNALQVSYKHNGRGVVLMAAALSQCDWMLARALPSSALLQPYLATYLIIILGSLGLLALLLFVVNVTASRISSPLINLSADISKISLGNMKLPEQKQGYTSRELIALDDAFRGMLARLDRAVDVEMQAYLRALQAQVNPHFLYNMLSVIIASSEACADERTVSMCIKLSEMLRYISDVKHQTVPLRDELNHARNYLDLMKQRYEDLFSYEIIVEGEIDGVRLPRLSVQPLAENCFVHGFTNEPPWHIRITASASADRWRVRVEDNGVGMTDTQIAELDKRIDRYIADVAGTYQELQIGGMGLINTLLRLRLMHSEPLSRHIENSGEGGLAVQIEGVIS
ncbi:MAG: histidine kinase [Oscillospiraceae bacterium]|jgi:sensor histidine kinase YesM|nr:histidine kinase [Oscillospiraceae bacterium]